MRQATIKGTGRRHAQLYLMSAFGFVLVGIFMYGPMWGVLVSLKDYSIYLGFWRSEWIGFQNFQRFLSNIYFPRLLFNTFAINVYELIVGFPAPIILALLLNEIRNARFKKSVQTISYFPHFISTVIIVGIMKFMLSSNGIVNRMTGLGINFFAEPNWFRTMYVFSGVWQGIGWGSIIYLAAISSVDQEMYEAAIIDGANRFQRMFRITIPAISSTIIILLILRFGRMMSVGFEKVYLMYSPILYSTADVFATYVYRMGLENGDFGYATAVGLFNNVINLILLLVANRTARRFGHSLW